MIIVDIIYKYNYPLVSDEDHEEGIIENVNDDDDLDITKPSKNNLKKNESDEDDI